MKRGSGWREAGKWGRGFVGGFAMTQMSYLRHRGRHRMVRGSVWGCGEIVGRRIWQEVGFSRIECVQVVASSFRRPEGVTFFVTCKYVILFDVTIYDM